MSKMTIAQAGKRGGKSTLKKYGRSHFSRLGKLSAKKRNNKSAK